MSDVNDVILKTFIEEANERLQNLNKGLLELEKKPDNPEVIEQLMRDAHTIKGSARMVGLEDISTIAHKLEDIFGLITKSKLKLEKALLNHMFASLDSIQQLIEQATGGRPQENNTQEICDKFDSIIKPEQIVTEERKEKQQPTSFKRSEKIERTAFRQIDDTVRVSALKLDSLVNLVGELVISESSTDYQERLLKELINFSSKIRSLVAAKNRASDNKEDQEKLNTSILELNRILQVIFGEFKKEKAVRDLVIQKLQYQVLDLRLLPVAVVFDAFPRMVRDMATAANKDVKLVLKGMETKLDKKVLEQIKDPLIHIIRNAMDHGFETEKQREKGGKNPQGELILSAYQEGENVVIEVADDGAGVDVEAVKKKALKQELASSKESADFTNEDWLNFIFESGFSTKKKADTISGRGVGLDVAKRNIEDLKGLITIKTEQGKGTKFIMKLPLTLAVSRALLIEIAGQKFAMPSTAIAETNIINPNIIQTIEGKETFRLRDKTVGIIDVAKTLGISKTSANGVGKKHLVCLSGYELIALCVDKFYGETEIIVKNAGIHLRNLPSIAGVTIVEGELIPILRPSYIIKRYQNKLGFSALTEKEEIDVDSEIKRILVVEDSLTTREMEKNMLEGAGYNVDEAADGLEALEKVNRKRYSLLIVDIQMPRMNGFELVEKIREQKIFESLPIVIVSSLDSDEDRAKGLEAGADYYVSKNDLLQKDLIEVVQEFIQ